MYMSQSVALQTQKDTRCLMPVLKRAVFDHDTALPGDWTQEDFAEFEKAVHSAQLDALALHYFGKQLPADFYAKCTKETLLCTGQMLQYEAELKRMTKMMSEAGIDMVVFKGGDLAYRCYPVSAMRRVSDLDILFRKEQIRDAMEILKKLGWTQDGEYQTEHHFCPLHKWGHLAIEPHFIVPGFPASVQDDLWKHTRLLPDGGRIFSPEVTFLLVMIHLEDSRWGYFSLLKFLLDFAYLLRKDPPDWQKLHELELQWGLPDSRCLLKAFSDFFPENLYPQEPAIDQKMVELFRYLTTRIDLYPEDDASITMHRSDILSKSWIFRTFRCFHPRNMRAKYKLPPHGVYGALIQAYGKDIASKFIKLTGYAAKQNINAEQMQYLDSLEQYRKLAHSRK